MIFLIIILDGCSINSLKNAQTPFLDSKAVKGFKTFNCTAVWPTATYTGHSSIVTGTFPERHGLVGNQFLDINDKKIKHFDYYSPSDYIQARTIFELFDSLTTMAIAEPITKGADYIFPMSNLNEIPLDEKNETIFNETVRILKNANIKLGVINFVGIDSFGETFGPNDKKYLDELSNVDNFLSRIYEIINEDLLMIITADHGMTSVTKRFDLNKYFENKGIEIKCLDSHRASHLYFDKKTNEILELLRNLKEIDKIFLKNQTKEINLFHDRTGDIALSASDGVELEKLNLNGSHGGFSDEELYVPLFIFSKNLKISFSTSPSSRKFSIVDIVPTILKLSNIKKEIDLQGHPI